MITRTIRYNPSTGWSEAFPDLDSESTLVLVFGASDVMKRPGPVRELRQAFPRSHVVGCSTAGQIVGESIEDEGLVAEIVKFERSSVRVATCRLGEASESAACGREVARALAGPGLRWVFVLSQGTSVNGTLLSRGIRESLSADVLVTGGIAGDGTRFESTWVCGDSDPEPGLVVGVGVYGDAVEVSHGCRGGWDPFGPERRVTRSSGNILYELDGTPALSLYSEYLGARAADLPASALLFPLAIRRPGEGFTLVRTVLGVSRQTQSMTFAGDVPEGSVAQLMRANFDRIVGGAIQAAEMACPGSAPANPGLCLSISCVGRRLLLRHRAEDELEGVRSMLPAGTSQVGFYSYGELSPLVGTGCELHNQTMTLTLVRERKEGNAPGARATAA